MSKKKAATRCQWTQDHPLMNEYHDTEWGVPLHDDRKHYEFMVLDGFQAGLSWLTILKRREGFRKAFAGFDVKKVARFGEKDVERLRQDASIIRNRQKIEAARNNARLFIELQKEFGSFDDYIWQFTGGKTKVNKWKNLGRIPPKTRESDAMSKDLKKRGFKFAGSTICYAYMQAAGMVNDHLVSCFRYDEINKMLK